MWLNIRCHCVKALFWLYSNTLPEKVPDISQSGIKTNLRRCKKCSELINPKSVREKKSTASEREWLLLMEETYSREDALKAEKD